MTACSPRLLAATQLAMLLAINIHNHRIDFNGAREREIWLIIVVVMFFGSIGLFLWRDFTCRAYQKKLLRKNKELETALSRAEESERMKTSFIEHVSHEIRTPLNVITGYAQIITNPLYDLDDDERDRMMKDISRNSADITNIVNELLELAQDESREYYNRNDAVVVNRLCRNVVNSMSAANNGRLTLDFHSLVNDDYTIRNNAKAIDKILGQLLKNALKFTPDGGTVELKVRERAANGGTEFTVTDTGIGIPPEAQDRIFERFYKVDSFKQGLGLGLTMARKMAELLGGTLTLDTKYKKGARFVLVLPR